MSETVTKSSAKRLERCSALFPYCNSLSRSLLFRFARFRLVSFALIFTPTVSADISLDGSICATIQIIIRTHEAHVYVFLETSKRMSSERKKLWSDFLTANRTNKKESMTRCNHLCIFYVQDTSRCSLFDSRSFYTCILLSSFFFTKRG